MPLGLPLGMPVFSPWNIVGNILFSALGYIAYSYGKTMGNWRVRGQGAVLMAYSYVVTDTLWLYAIGAVLTGWVWYTRND